MPIVSWRFARERGLELGADAVGAADQDRLVVAGREPAQRREPADAAEHLGPHRRLRERLDPVDQGVAGVDVDARVLVGERHRGARVPQQRLAMDAHARAVPPRSIDVVVPARDHAATLPDAAARPAASRASARSSSSIARRRDRTAEIARDAGALVLREPTRRLRRGVPARAGALLVAAARARRRRVHPRRSPGGRAARSPRWSRRSPSAASSSCSASSAAQARVGEKLVTGLIDTVYRHRWSGVGPVRAMRFPALVALGMSDRGDGWDVEMLVRARQARPDLRRGRAARATRRRGQSRDRRARAAPHPASRDHAIG